MAESAPKQTPLAPRLHGAPCLSPSPSRLSLSLSYANTRNIFQMLFAFALHTIFAWRARCVPAFSHFSIFHVRFVVVADDTTHIHTHTNTHAHATHYTCIRGFVLLTFSLFFLCDIFFPPFFLRALPNNSHRLPKGSCPRRTPLYSPGDKSLYACAAAAVATSLQVFAF